MLKIIRNADYDKWKNRVKGDDAPCIICGRGAGSNAPVVHVHNGGDSVVTDEEVATLDDAGDLGLQPIGRNCLKKHPEYLPYVKG